METIYGRHGDRRRKHGKAVDQEIEMVSLKGHTSTAMHGQRLNASELPKSEAGYKSTIDYKRRLEGCSKS